MSDFVLRLIRTYVPIIVGAVVSWLAVRFTIVVPEDIQAQAVSILTGAFIAIYYTAVSALGRRWPIFERLLGSAKTPTYTPPPA